VRPWAIGGINRGSSQWHNWRTRPDCGQQALLKELESNLEVKLDTETDFSMFCSIGGLEKAILYHCRRWGNLFTVLDRFWLIVDGISVKKEFLFFFLNALGVRMGWLWITSFFLILVRGRLGVCIRGLISACWVKKWNKYFININIPVVSGYSLCDVFLFTAAMTGFIYAKLIRLLSENWWIA